ncbi:hypothetical protein SK128_019782 [Halocaridina rubra]|uniref:Uncharacterized protein n=1 Tax=Halocaridina rubra TaxID=373956 RepID=A0AAN8WRF4_HALRR
MRKHPKSHTFRLIKKGAAILFAAEVTIFAGCYYVYHRMNTQRDFRHYMSNNYPYALEAYYSVGEFFNSANKTRQIDQNIWIKQFPTSASSK